MSAECCNPSQPNKRSQVHALFLQCTMWHLKTRRSQTAARTVFVAVMKVQRLQQLSHLGDDACEASPLACLCAAILNVLYAVPARNKLCLLSRGRRQKETKCLQSTVHQPGWSSERICLGAYIMQIPWHKTLSNTAQRKPGPALLQRIPLCT